MSYDAAAPVITPPPIPAIRRVVTGHTNDGRAVILEDAPVPPRPMWGRGPSFFNDLYWTDHVPAENSIEWVDVVQDHANEHVGPDGASFRAADFPPGQLIVSANLCLNF